MDVPGFIALTPGLGSLRTDDSRSARNQQDRTVCLVDFTMCAAHEAKRRMPMTGRGIRWQSSFGSRWWGFRSGLGRVTRRKQLHKARSPGRSILRLHLHILSRRSIRGSYSHDALLCPTRCAGQTDARQYAAPSLAESWTESPDGLVYEFRLRQE